MLNEKKMHDSMIQECHELSNIKKVYGIISGKGGVGKSLVTSLIAILKQREGYKTAILDADITGPSIPKIFGIKGKSFNNQKGMFPLISSTGIKIMSTNFLLENETDPVVWRGPLISKIVKEFWTDVIWEDIDYMFIDMPPGTGDVPLTIFQSIPIDGIIVVTSPQELVSMIVSKAIKMAEIMNIPIIGLIENFSYYKCDECKKINKIFGDSHIDSIAKKNELKVLGKIPIDSLLSSACDNGLIEYIDSNILEYLKINFNEVKK